MFVDGCFLNKGVYIIFSFGMIFLKDKAMADKISFTVPSYPSLCWTAICLFPVFFPWSASDSLFTNTNPCLRSAWSFPIQQKNPLFLCNHWWGFCLLVAYLLWDFRSNPFSLPSTNGWFFLMALCHCISPVQTEQTQKWCQWNHLHIGNYVHRTNIDQVYIPDIWTDVMGIHNSTQRGTMLFASQIAFNAIAHKSAWENEAIFCSISEPFDSISPLLALHEDHRRWYKVPINCSLIIQTFWRLVQIPVSS